MANKSKILTNLKSKKINEDTCGVARKYLKSWQYAIFKHQTLHIRGYNLNTLEGQI